MGIFQRFLPIRRETRASGGGTYTDAVVRLLGQQATATSSARAADTGAYETAAGLWERAFASATVQDAGMAAAALTPPVLGYIGRQLIATGESVHLLRIVGGGPMLLPAHTWDISGNPNPASWRYTITLPGPDMTETIMAPASAVIHCRYATLPAEPWRGVSPLAAETTQLAATLESELRKELAINPAHVLPLPPSADRDKLAADLKISALAIVDAQGPSFGGNPQGGAQWHVIRIGPAPPPALIELRKTVNSTLLAACGVPIELLDRTDGAGRREAWRQFLHSSVGPVARSVSAELAAKLDAPNLELNFDSLFASDLSGRARAFQSLVGGGMDIAGAAALAGLAEPEM